MALLIPPPFDREVDTLRRAAGDGSLERIPPHLTLVPPVNVRDEHLGDALDVLRAAAAATRPFTAELGPVTTFHPDSPTLYLAVGEGVDAVYAVRDRVFQPPLARKLTWPFVPHVTLADEMEEHRLHAAVDALRDYRVTVTFDRVHLLQEQEGRRWEPIADVAFAAPAVIGRGGLELQLSVTDAPDPEAQAFADREWPVFDVAELGVPAFTRWPFTITARRDGEVVGVAEGWTLGGVGYLSGLIVAASGRGEGIGSHLLAAFTSLAAERDCEEAVLRTIAGTPAERFYRERGWEEDARWGWWFGRVQVQLRRAL